MCIRDRTKISQLNGTVNVFSQKGQGSKIVIKVPLTLAIMPTLMVMLENQAFAFPLVNVNEIFHLDLSRTNVVDGQEAVSYTHLDVYKRQADHR